MKKVTTVRLLVFLVVLLLIYSAMEFFGTSGRSSSFRSELVSIDTAQVTKVLITKGSETLNLVDADSSWIVFYTEDEVYSAVGDRVRSALASLQAIKPSRVATRNPEKWAEFQVDSTGIRVEVFEGGDRSLDIVLGRFGMQGQQQFHTYVRLFDDNDVYVAENFMSFSLSTSAESYRNQKLTQFAVDSVDRIRFRYPGDSSYVLQRSPARPWLLDGQPADSTEVQAYLNALSRATSSKFAQVREILINPTFEMRLEIRGFDPILIKAFAETDSTFLITSTSNREGIFRDPALFGRIFKPRSEFLDNNTLQ